MKLKVQIASPDPAFANILGNKLSGWGLSVVLQEGYIQPVSSAILAGEVDVLLLDIRDEGEKALSWLALVKEMMVDIEVLLINRPGEINIAMEGMRIGASDELTTPFDTAILKKKVLAAARRRKRRLKGRRGEFLGMFQKAMAAATFAQAGEFETALTFLDSTQDKKETGRKPGKK